MSVLNWKCVYCLHTFMWHRKLLQTNQRRQCVTQIIWSKNQEHKLKFQSFGVAHFVIFQCRAFCIYNNKRKSKTKKFSFFSSDCPIWNDHFWIEIKSYIKIDLFTHKNKTNKINNSLRSIHSNIVYPQTITIIIPYL